MIKYSGWLEKDKNDPEFQKLVSYETFIEMFLSDIEVTMGKQEMSRKKLAEKLGWKLTILNNIFNRTRELKIRELTDLCYALGVDLKLKLIPKESI